MFEGKSKFNGSVFGWAGHMENGSNFGSIEVLEVLNTNWSHYVDNIGVDNNRVTGYQIKWLKPQQVLQCTYFDQTYLQNEDWRRNDLFFEFPQRPNASISIFVSDKRRKVSRTLKSNYETYTGSRIVIEDLDKPMLKKFYFTFQQTELSPEVD